jgi:osmotically-inducible protein OsmY
VQIALGVEELQKLPPYRNDHELQREVEEILDDLPFLHIDRRGSTLRVQDGVLYMDGNTSSKLRGDMMSDQVQGVQGLQAIHNHLVGDDVLAQAIARAIGEDERTRDLPLGVYPELGRVRLSGAVSTAAQKEAVVEIARTIPGTREVMNDLQIDSSTAMLYVMSASEGGETRDIVPGKMIRHTK